MREIAKEILIFLFSTGTAEKKSLTVENKQIEKELKKLAELDSRWVSIDPNQISFSIAGKNVIDSFGSLR